MKDRTETDDAATARLALDMWFDDREFLGMDAKVQMVETTETDLVTGYRTASLLKAVVRSFVAIMACGGVGQSPPLRMRHGQIARRVVAVPNHHHQGEPPTMTNKILINGEPFDMGSATTMAEVLRQPSWVEALQAAEREMEKAAETHDTDIINARINAATTWVRIAEVYAQHR